MREGTKEEGGGGGRAGQQLAWCGPPGKIDLFSYAKLIFAYGPCPPHRQIFSQAEDVMAAAYKLKGGLLAKIVFLAAIYLVGQFKTIVCSYLIQVFVF